MQVNVRITRIAGGFVVACVVIYLVFFGVVLWAMCQPPQTFGRFMRNAPEPLVFGLLPARPMWLWARAGALDVGSMAPDFSLPLLHRAETVRLSAFRGKRPVALIFGSYT